jgi:hypothetical protein
MEAQRMLYTVDEGYVQDDCIDYYISYMGTVLTASGAFVELNSWTGMHLLIVSF